MLMVLVTSRDRAPRRKVRTLHVSYMGKMANVNSPRRSLVSLLVRNYPDVAAVRIMRRVIVGSGECLTSI